VDAVRASDSAHRGHAVARAPAGARVVRRPRRWRRGRVEARARSNTSPRPRRVRRRVDVAEARRAFEIGRQAANARLVALKDEVRAEYPGDEAIAPVPVSELALAWVRAV